MKNDKLLSLARLRQSERLRTYKCLGDFHEGAYECDFVSPWTKSAYNLDAEIMLIAQDWAAESFLSEKFDPELAQLGYDPSLPTNKNLQRLLEISFGKKFDETYATNVFPFIKCGSMSAAIGKKDLRYCAQKYAIPQVEIIKPKLVICLGAQVYDAIRYVMRKNTLKNMDQRIQEAMFLKDTVIACVAHTGRLGTNNRGLSQVEQDWASLRQYL